MQLQRNVRESRALGLAPTLQLATHRSYVQRSRRKTVSFGNSTSTAYGYNSRGALESIAHDLAGTANDVNFGFLHNQASEITTRNLSNNRYAWTPTKAANRTLEVNGLNQITKITTAGFAPQTVAHDTAGNLSGDGTNFLFTYDLDNKLRSSQETQAGGVLARNATLSYDAEGRLIKEDGGPTPSNKSVTQFLYDGSDLIAEFNVEGDLVRRYVHGPGVDEPVVALSYSETGSSKEWVYADQLGSVVATANAAGDASSQRGYGPFGEPNQTGGLRFKYTGQTYLSNVGLYYYKARFYSAELGRFLQTDPVGVADDLNQYLYVAADPINNIDPEGKWLVQVGMFVVGAGVDVGAQMLFQNKSWREVNYKEAAIAGAGAVITGNVGGRLAQAAYRGTMSSANAITLTGITASGVGATGSVAGDLWNGNPISAPKAILNAAFGGLGATTGARIANGAAARLESHMAKGGIAAHVAEASRSGAAYGSVAFGTSTGAELGKFGADFLSSGIGKYFENMLPQSTIPAIGGSVFGGGAGGKSFEQIARGK
jgi:RHS repeat-associated protein